MSLALPTSLSPSKVASFKDCALAFRYSAIDHLPEPPSPHAAKGTLVHRALELLMWEEPAGGRSIEVALAKLARARHDVLDGEEYAGVDFGDQTEEEFLADAEQLVRNYFRLEDPNWSASSGQRSGSRSRSGRSRCAASSTAWSSTPTAGGS
jgi:putative RecB family exonuclease